MSQNHKIPWTSEHLLKPQGTALFAAQQRERLRQMANEIQGLLSEYRAALENIRIDGDKPLEPKVRAFRATRPMASMEKHLREALNEAGDVDAEFIRFYKELPVKREQRAAAKALRKARRAEAKKGRGMQAVDTAAGLHGIASGFSESQRESSEGKSQEKPAATFLDFLKEA
ncbi:hypothetical protein [Kitasatospora sp. NPDC054795]